MKNIWKLVSILLIVAVLVSCQKAETAPAASTGTNTDASAVALAQNNQGGLDTTAELALGTLKLEDTPNAVAPDQAASLLPLWTVIQRGELESAAETDAVLKQIQGHMSETQLAAIEAMALTAEDMQSWMAEQDIEMPARPEGQGGPGALGDLSEDERANMREQMQNMTAEERATRMAEMGMERPQGAEGRTGFHGASGTEGQSNTMLTPLLELLAERSGTEIAQEVETPPTAPEPTATPVEAVEVVEEDGPDEVVPTPTPELETVVDEDTVTDGDAVVESEAKPELETEESPATTPVEVVSAEPVAAAVATPAPEPALEQIEDTNPGPPFTVEVSANTATQDPVVEASQTYKVTGIVRNDGDQTYAVSTLNVTFYDAEGFRGTFQPAVRDGKVVSGEWLWHGQAEAELAALLLAPGEEWPFEIEIVAQDMASFLIHPDATPTGRESVIVALSDVRMVDEGTDYLRISGTATNTSAYAVKNVTVSGVLLDGNGQIVSVGSAYVLQEDISPGETVGFDVRVTKEAYASNQVYAQAERDWD